MNIKALLSFVLSFVIIANISYAKFNINARTAILQDYLSGEILYEKNPDERIFPASMTKIMTSIVAFDLLKSGEITLEEKFIVSENAWRLSSSGYSSMFIMVGDEVSVEDLLLGIIVASGNDACVALAEGIAGTEDEFALLMTEKAQEIGMENTNFSNSSGINDDNNYSTVRDILIMSNYLIKQHPKYYEYFKIKEFTWNRTGGDPITQGNRNPLLYKNMGVDGIKTGYLGSEKYSLASSLLRKKRRLIAVASGFETKRSRSKQSQKLLTWGITNFDTIKISNNSEYLYELDVWQGDKKKVKVNTKDIIYKTIPKAKKKYMKVKIVYNGPIQAPIKEGEKLAEINILYKDEIISNYDLYSLENINQQNAISRLITSINYLIWGDV